MTEQRNDAVSLAGALKNAALAYGPNGSGGMRIVADFTSPDEALPLFEILSDAADEDAPECFQCGEVYGENPQCPVHGRNTTAWEHCRIGSCQRHQNCMYHPCRSSNAISPSPAPSPLEGEVRHAADELAAFATLLERPPLDDVEIEEKLAVRITKSIRTILSALSTEAGSGRHPCPDILREDHNEAVDWITANCMATRRDNGNMDYSLGAMIAAYEAGKKATAEAGKPAGEEPVKRIEDGHADTEGEAAGPLCRWRRNARLL